MIVNVSKAIIDNAETTIKELVDERQRLIARVLAINVEIATWQTLNELVGGNNAVES